MEPGADIRLTRVVEGGAARIDIEGVLDFASAPALRREIDRCLADGARNLEIRLARIPLMDSSGLSAVIYGYKMFARRGGELRLVGDEAVVARLLKRTSLDRVIPLHSAFETRQEGRPRPRGTNAAGA